MFSRLAALSALLLTVSLSTVVPAAGPASAAPGVREVDAGRYAVYQAHDFTTYRFKTADGNLACELYETTGTSPWACAANAHTWKLPSLPVSGEGQGAARDGIGMGRDSSAFVVRPYYQPDLQVQKPTRVLPRGSRITVDGLTCTASRRAGVDSIRCVDQDGATLTISRKKLTYTTVR